VCRGRVSNEKLRPLIFEIERRLCGGSKSKKISCISPRLLGDSTEGLNQVYSRAHRRSSLRTSGYIILPMLRYSNAPKVRGCRVQFQETASMAKWSGPQCRSPYIRDTIMSLSRHSQVYESSLNSPVQQQIRRQPADEPRDTEWHLHGMSCF
jgi:hypothetical protein